MVSRVGWQCRRSNNASAMTPLWIGCQQVGWLHKLTCLAPHSRSRQAACSVSKWVKSSKYYTPDLVWPSRLTAGGGGPCNADRKVSLRKWSGAKAQAIPLIVDDLPWTKFWESFEGAG